MDNRTKKPISIADRFITALLAALVVLTMGVLFGFVMVRIIAVEPDYYIVYWKSVFLLTVLFSFLGFIVGGDKFSRFVGMIFKTNKPKDGDWL